MSVPTDAITAFHNAFRRDMAIIDTAALEAAGGAPDREETIGRYRFCNEVLVWHAHGEELAVFPALEKVAPLVAEAYVMDHHRLDVAFEALDAAVAAGDPLATARASAAFKFHLDTHLDKEDAHLYRLFRERISIADQGQALTLMSSNVPQERFAEVVMWLYPLLGGDDRENMTRIWQMVMPPDVFSAVKGLIKTAVGDDWVDLTRSIPELAG